MESRLENFLQELEVLIKKNKVDLEKNKEQNDSESKLRIISHNREAMVRMTGRTTRLVDSYIQLLFENIGEYIKVKDHYNHIRADKHLIERIEERLYREYAIKVDKIVRNVGFLLRIPIKHKREKDFFKENGDVTFDISEAFGLDVEFDHNKY